MLFVPQPTDLIIQSTLGRPTATLGVSVTPGTGSFGSWVQLLAAQTYDVYGILIHIHSNSASIASRNSVINVGIDPAGGTSYTTLIPNLIAGGAPILHTNGVADTYYFPLFIPAGSTVGVQAYGSVTTAFYVIGETFAAPANPLGIKVGSLVEAIGISTYNGTSVTPGTTSDGSWTSLGTTTRDLWDWTLGFQIDTSDTSWQATALAVELAVGSGGTYKVILSDDLLFTHSSEYKFSTAHKRGQVFVPGGATIYGRVQLGGSTADTMEMAAYGVGG